MFQFYEYQLPFKKPFTTGSGTFSQRSGLLICFNNGDENVWSEASPLPGFSSESLPDVISALLKHSAELNRFFSSGFDLKQLNIFLNDLPPYPSVQFGISFLGAVLLSERKNQPLSGIFGLEASEKIGVNAVIGSAPPRTLRKQIFQSIEQGFRVIKLKALPPAGPLAKILTGVHEAHPDIRFRLDANQSWPPDQLEKISGMFSHLPIEYIEEPVAVRSVSEIPAIQKKLSHPLALDESVKNLDELHQLLSVNQTTYVIIKPMILGNFFKIAGTIRSLRSKFERIVVTTCLESAIGRSMTETAASLIGDKTLSHGLNTGLFFKHDLYEDSEIKNGYLSLSDYRFRNKSVNRLPKKHLNLLG
jgi:o-succinylbenzoate synthase